MKQVHQRMTEWCGRGGLQPARLVREMVRELACPVVGVENSAVHGKDEEAGPGRRGRCGGCGECGEIWLSDKHGDEFLSAMAVPLGVSASGRRCHSDAEGKSKMRAITSNGEKGGNLRNVQGIVGGETKGAKENVVDCVECVAPRQGCLIFFWSSVEWACRRSDIPF